MPYLRGNSGAVGWVLLRCWTVPPMTYPVTKPGVAMPQKLLPMLLAVLLLLVTASAQAQGPSQATMRAVEATMQQAQDGDPLAAMEGLLDLRDELSGGDLDASTVSADSAVLTFYAGSFAQMAEDHERALDLHLEASDAFRSLGRDYLPISAFSLDRAAMAQHGLGRYQEAYETLIAARNLRRETAAAPDGNAVEALRLAGAIAMELRDAELVIAEMNAAYELAFQQAGKHQPLVTAQAATQAAELAVWLGAYPMADMVADSAAGAISTAAFGLWQWTPELDAQRPYICNELAGLLRQLGGLRIDFANFGGADILLSYTFANVADPLACADTLTPETMLYDNLLKARLFLHAGDPFSAHLRLRGYEEGRAEAGLPPAVTELSDKIARTRQAMARVALGFPGEAGELLAQVEAGGGLASSPVQERERLLAIAMKAHLEGDIETTLDVLDEAEILMKEQAPLHWYPRAEIAFRRALIHIEHGFPERAIATRESFEAELAEFAAAQRDLGRELETLLADGQTAYETQMLGEEAALDLRRQREEGLFETPAFRELDKMRLLFDLSMAAHHGSADDAETAFSRVPLLGLPTSVGLSGHTQRAYLLACLRAKGMGLECSMAIRSAFEHPASTPYACIGLCPWIQGDAAQLVVNADMVRRSPLIARFAEPVLAWLVRAADSSVDRNGERSEPAGTHPTVFENDPAFARTFGRWQGADIAFEMVQHVIEGRAAAAVGQLGSRLASGSDEVGALMRERQLLTEQVDALFRSAAASAGEIPRLSERLKELSDQLAALRPDHADLFSPGAMSVEEISELLPDGSVFVLIFTTEAATYVFAVREGELEWHRAPLGAAALEERVARLRVSLDPDALDRGAVALTGNTAAKGRAFDRGLAHAIYRDVLEPVATVVNGADMYVVADGPLGSLPLSVLVRNAPKGADDDPDALRKTDWLARSHAMTLLPSPAALRVAALQRQRPRAELPFIGFGDPVFSPPDDENAPFRLLSSLPGTRAEVRHLAELLGAREDDVHLGADATKSAILDADLSGARVLAFATHGLLAGQIADAAEPGLVFTHPAPGAGMSESYLTASEAATLRINADWVLLSACNTAGPDGRPDSEGLSGLARAFLFAGARSVLVSYWPVRDDAAMLLTTEALSWHESNPEASRASALRHAMITLLDRADTPDFAHPSAWAPFVLLGDG